MTGEVTLTGRVLPVGGVREKVLAARRAGVKTVLIPRHNENDLLELPTEVKNDLTFFSVDTLDDVVPHLFETPPAKPKRSSKAAPGTRVRAAPKIKAPAVPAPVKVPKPRVPPATARKESPRPARRPRPGSV